MDSETKKAREAFKREQYELERKRGRKVLIPKCFMKINYWNPKNMIVNLNSDEIKLFERLQIVPLNTQLPIAISNDSNEAQKAPQTDEHATPKVNKKANKEKEAVQNTSTNDGSPITIGFRSKMKEKKEQQQQQQLNTSTNT